MKKLYFTRDWTPYNRGETAVFEDEAAKPLLEGQFAVDAEAPAPAPEAAPVESDPTSTEEKQP